MTVKKIENVAGIVDPMSLNEYRLAISSGQSTKASIYAFNLILNLTEEIGELKDEIAALKKPAPKPRTKNASNQSGGTIEDGPAE